MSSLISSITSLTANITVSAPTGAIQLNLSTSPTFVGITLSGAITSTQATGTVATFGTGGVSTNAPTISFNGGSGVGGGAYLIFQQNSVSKGYIGSDSAVNGGTNANMTLYAVGNWTLYAGNTSVGTVTSTGLNSCAIGATTASTGAFTTLAASGTITSTVDGLQLARTGASTGYQYLHWVNTSGEVYFGIENSSGGGLLTGSTAYATVIVSNTNKPIQLGGASAVWATFTSTVFTFGATTASTSTSTGAVVIGNGSSGGLGVGGSIFCGGNMTLSGSTAGSVVSSINNAGAGYAELAFGTNQGNRTGFMDVNSGSGSSTTMQIGTTITGAGVSIYTGATTLAMVIAGSGAIQMAHYGSGAATFDGSGNITSVSDARYKVIDHAFTRGMEAIRLLEPQVFHWNELSGLNRDDVNAGFIAQNVLVAIPEAVGQNKDGFYTLSDRPITGALVNATKQLDARMTQLEKENAALRARLSSAGM